MKSKREFRMYQLGRFIYWVVTFTRHGCPKIKSHDYFSPTESHFIPKIGYMDDNFYCLKTIPVPYA